MTKTYTLTSEMRYYGRRDDRRTVIVFTRIDPCLYKAYREAKLRHRRSPALYALDRPEAG
jgi:hypothetical protein